VLQPACGAGSSLEPLKFAAACMKLRSNLLLWRRYAIRSPHVRQPQMISTGFGPAQSLPPNTWKIGLAERRNAAWAEIKPKREGFGSR
jgi:hypothetical protein